MTSFSYEPGRIVMGRLERGDDVLKQLTAACEEHQISVGTLSALGAVERATVGYYDQAAQQYHQHVFNQPMEIIQLTGNISGKDGETFLHCHVTLSDDEGCCYGGHLFEGTTVFACEFVLNELRGPVPQRKPHAPTGLALW
jgi:predicted DNA-binding protein with PD1-like motif